MSIHNATLVSAFIKNVNNRYDKTFDTYMQHGALLLQANVPKIIFADNETYATIKHMENSSTKIVAVTKSECYLYDNRNKITNFTLNTDNNTKDTLEYILTICSKTEWIYKAIELNPFNTPNYTWVDFGIRHVFKCDNNTFITKIESLNDKVYNYLRIGSIWDLNRSYDINLYTDIAWYFAGGVFGGEKTALKLFSKKMKEMCLRIIRERGTLMWEVNVWYLIYKENPTLFDCYYCDHNDSLIDNY